MIRIWTLVIFMMVAAVAPASAHEVRPAYLALEETQPDIWEVTWKQPVLSGKRLKLTPKFSASGGQSCGWTVEERDNLAATSVERGDLSCTISVISIEGLDRTLTDVIVEVRPLSGEVTTTLLRPDANELDITAPAQSPAAAYFAIGVEHIVFGWDHLLFVIALVFLIDGKRRLLGVITAFTLAHSLTLGLAAMGVIGIPSRPVEILIAASIVLLGIELIRKRQGEESLLMQRPYLVAIVVGLVHGLGFAGALSEIGLPDGTELLALLMFNLGVEAGQIGVILVSAIILAGLPKIHRHAANRTELCAAYALGSIGMFWVIERLAQYVA